MLFTALDIRATYFSRGRVAVIDEEGKEIENDKALDLFNNPNYSQSQQDFLYKHEWYKCLGNNVTRVLTISDSKSPNDINNVMSLEHLVPSLIEYNDVNKFSKMKLSKTDKKTLSQKTIEYKKIPIPINELAFFYDITNGLYDESTFVSPSRIKSLIPSLANIDEAQKAKNINLKFTSKFIVSNNPVEGSPPMLKEDEKNNIENTLMGKDIITTGAKITVNPLANNISKLMFDEGLNSDSMKVFSAFGISRDVLNYFTNGATTYDNKNTGLLDFIQGTIKAEANDFSNTWTTFFKYKDQGKKIVIKYDHLPVMKLLEVAKIDVLEKKAKILRSLVDSGASFETASSMVDLSELKKGVDNE